MTIKPLLTSSELRAIVGWSRSYFRERELAGAYKHLLLARPDTTTRGGKKYSGAKVEQWLAGESTVTLVRRTA